MTPLSRVLQLMSSLDLDKNSVKITDFVRGIISPILVLLTKETPALRETLNKALTALRRDVSSTIFLGDKGEEFVFMDVRAHIQKALDIFNVEETY